ncbi:MAG TPA: sensor histidine kinase [Propionibacteriaceae bacterium]|nr:HAMP domain-containing histidine kinase [Micropruina sp.]HBX80063.1 sensor histidine kinase [Propionibacteriaceae bacterium]HBY23856.1 sensor histidine kinase [Propionibacteriaceae bacterium]
MQWLVATVLSLTALGLALRLPIPRRVRFAVAAAAAVVPLAGIAVHLWTVANSDVIGWIALWLVALGIAAAAGVAATRWRSDRAEVERLRGIARRNADQVSVLSHEVRTSLTLMSASADLLLEGTPGPLNERQQRYLTTIRGNCQSVTVLAEDLLTQARIDAGMFELHPQVVRLRPLAQAVVRELREIHTMTLALDSPGAPPQVWADPSLLRQALINLINNAITHARGAQLITVRIVSRENNVLISVSDDGEGIDADMRDRLFERFSSGKPLRDGTGLGLLITRQIVQMHGGDMFVDTAPGGGTTMMASLPARTDPWQPDADQNGGK